VTVGEAQAFVRQTIDVRGLQGGGPVRGHIAVAKIVRVDEDDVRSFLGSYQRGEEHEHLRDE
jgi:hypothetical protein